MFKTTSCGYSELVSWEAWYDAKGISLIQASLTEKTPKTCLKIDIFSLTDKRAISDHFFDVFSGQDARIELNPFALNQASQDTRLEYPHGVVCNILKITFFRDWPPLGDPLNPFLRKIKNVPMILILYNGIKITCYKISETFWKFDTP